MYLGKAEQVTISGLDKQGVIDEANKYCKENAGWSYWSGILVGFKWMGWFKWKKEYEIKLYKPIDYRIIRPEYDFKINKNLFYIDGELYGCSDAILKDGDLIVVANDKNELIITKYPYNGLMGMKVIFSTKQFENSKPDFININAQGFVLAVTPNEVQK